MQVLELVLENFVYPWYRYVLSTRPFFFNIVIIIKLNILIMCFQRELGCFKWWQFRQLFVGEGCVVHYKIFSSSPGLFPLDDYQILTGRPNQPQLGITDEPVIPALVMLSQKDWELKTRPAHVGRLFQRKGKKKSCFFFLFAMILSLEGNL
jgi:hypothetical protein